MLPRPSKPDSAHGPASSEPPAGKGLALSKALRDSFFSKLSNYRREMQPHHARWEQQWQEAHRVYAQDFICALALRDCIQSPADEYHQQQMRYDARVPAAICCDFMHWRANGAPAQYIIREFHRRGLQQIGERRKSTPAAVLVERSPTSESISRLYASCHRTLVRDRRPGLAEFPDLRGSLRPALERLGGIRIPRGFLSAYEASEGLAHGAGEAPAPASPGMAELALQQKNRAHYLSGIGRIVDYLTAGGAPLLLVLMERPDSLAEHVLVCDFSESHRGIFDPDYGFMSLPDDAGAAEFAPLLAKIAYRYSAHTLIAFQETAAAA